MTDPAAWPAAADAVATAAAVRAGATSATAVVTAALDRVRQVDPLLRLFTSVSTTALDEAAAIDAAQRHGAPPGALAGVPITVKDWIDVRGQVSGHSFGGVLQRLAAADATAVARLRQAGAIVVARTRASGAADQHPGPFNPHDPARTCGASSGGEAAARAAGVTALGLGSDSGGSIRWPAHCCGVVGVKPSAGRVPVTGHVPPVIALTDPRTVIGPLANRVADAALALRLMAGADAADPAALPVPWDAPAAATPRGLRVAWFTEFGAVTADGAAVAAVRRAVDALRAGGAVVCEARPEGLDDARPVTEAYWARPESISLHAWRPPHRSRLGADAVERSLFTWDRLQRALHAFFNAFDLLVTPVAPTAAPLARAATASDYAFLLPWSLGGQPAVALPFGHDRAGLPVAVQLVGGRFRDAGLLAVAQWLEAQWLQAQGDGT